MADVLVIKSLFCFSSWALLTSTWRSLLVQAPRFAAVYWRATTPRTLGRTTLY